MSVKAKFYCSNVDAETKQVRFSAVISDTPENKTWSEYTPSGSLTMSITNPDAFSQFEQGKEYFLTIEPA